ncbi:MAG: tetratricopeptide repeat protein [Anaerolineae bacterium]|nr:tetratricopeptide repeat protein [Anaerolineae bacterium]
MTGNKDLDAFNERELDILKRIAQGQSNREIADDLYITMNTVRWYNKQIYSKLGVHSRTLAVAQAREFGLLDSDAATADSVLDATDELTNLPANLTPFVGRAQELTELSALFDDPKVRLVTIIGPGGMGKTRLSQEVARDQLGDYRDGVFLIALAPVQADGGSVQHTVVNAIATALHVPLQDNVEAQLLNYLSRKQMLLLIDNFEHLLDGAAIVGRILENAPQVRVLATSREILGLYGEAVYHLSGMPVPEREALDSIETYDAVQLFIQSASRVRADFEPDRDELFQIARICKLVEGLPLGIELAAGWVRSLSLSEILEELQQGLDILETRVSDIRSVFDRSWHLLSANEQIAFARMSVFRGGCTREAAQAVTGTNTRMLTSLVDKSLLWHLADAHYAMHELLRQYAAEKFQQMADREAVIEQHSAYYAAFAGRWGRALEQGQQIEALEVIAREFENIRAAWHHALDTSQDMLLKELVDTWYFFDIRGRWQEGNELFLLAAEHVTDPLTLARLLARRTNFMFRVGLGDQTEAQARRSIELFKEAGAEGETGMPLLSLGNIALMHGDTDEAERYWNEGVEIAERHDDKLILAATLGNLCLIEKSREQFDQAKAHLQRQLAIARELGDHMQASMALINLGELARELGDLEAAKTYYQSSLVTGQRIGQQFVIAGAFGQLGLVARYQQRYDEARQLLSRSLMINRENNNRLFMIRNLSHLAEVAADEGDFIDACFCYMEALKLAESLHVAPVALMALNSLAYCLYKHGDLARAVEIWTLIQHHPVTQREDRARAESSLLELCGQMDPTVYNAAVARGQEIDLETLLTALIVDLELPSQ